MLLDCCALWMLETRMTSYLRWHSLLFTLGTPAAAFMIKKQHLSCQPPSSFSKRLMRHCHYICYHLSPSDYLMEDFGMQGYGMLCWWHHYILLGLLRDLQWRKGEPWSKRSVDPGSDAQAASGLVLQENELAPQKEIVNKFKHILNKFGWIRNAWILG